MTTWTELPNYVIEGKGLYGGSEVTEQLWARKMGDGSFILLCLPFYLYGLALSDRVTVEATGTLKVVEPSGRQLLRVWFHTPKDEPEQFDREVGERGGRTEWYSRNLVAIDCSASGCIVLREWLSSLKSQGLIDLEWASQG